jgi:hypothetical protein
MAKPTYTISTPYGDFERVSWRAYEVAAIWMDPRQEAYIASWHMQLQGVEKSEFAIRCQLMGVYKVRPKTSSHGPSEVVPYQL